MAALKRPLKHVAAEMPGSASPARRSSAPPSCGSVRAWQRRPTNSLGHLVGRGQAAAGAMPVLSAGIPTSLGKTWEDVIFDVSFKGRLVSLNTLNSDLLIDTVDFCREVPRCKSRHVKIS